MNQIPSSLVITSVNPLSASWIPTCTGITVHGSEEVVADDQAITGSVGEASLIEDIEGAIQDSGTQLAHRPAVLADGSYATQTALADLTNIPSSTSGTVPNVR